ncbi:MAG: methyltransferase domain-containing protein [Pseudomonadales bacterium]|nr:methyltransferase domain-containing protein [Pseudomonadales bacterium]
MSESKSEATGSPVENSHTAYRGRYFDARRAARYAGKQNHTATHRREMRCLSKALAGLPAGSRVLDLPCGAARLLPELLEMGFDVTAADVAPPMVEEARKYAASLGLADKARFAVGDALNSGFKDNEFDAVICNRLFHHFSEREIRVAGLKELKRISSGRVIISFFCNLALDGLTFHLQNALRSNKSVDRIPIPYGEMKANVAEAGMRVVGVYPMRPLISRQWYLHLER